MPPAGADEDEVALPMKQRRQRHEIERGRAEQKPRKRPAAEAPNPPAGPRQPFQSRSPHRPWSSKPLVVLIWGRFEKEKVGARAGQFGEMGRPAAPLVRFRPVFF